VPAARGLPDPGLPDSGLPGPGLPDSGLPGPGLPGREDSEDALHRGVTAVDRALRAHRGGAELVSRGSDGEVVLRLTGMCTGCVFWPATVAGTVKPLLEHSMGTPVSVSIEGRRVSEAAMARLAKLAPSRRLTEHLSC
jgi:Fe-S cluster biogenesis protein NfuA